MPIDQEQFIIDEKSIFPNKRGYPIARARDGSALYVFYGLGSQLIEKVGELSGLGLIPPGAPNYVEAVRHLVDILQEKEYGPRGEELTLGAGITVVGNRCIILKNDVGIWKKIIAKPLRAIKQT